jgi:hypothetical protein
VLTSGKAHYYFATEKGISDDILNNLKGFKVKKPTMTWAPSHIELALLSDLLHYANIIDGLNETDKRTLRYDLEIMVNMEDDFFTMNMKRFNDLNSRFYNKSVLMGYEEKHEKGKLPLFCIELCPEYIDYLKEILKPYL